MEAITDLTAVLADAQAKFDNAQYAAAMTAFEQVQDMQPDSVAAKLYIPACRFLSGDHTGERLAPAWEEIFPVFEQAVSQKDGALQAVRMARRVASVCTAAVYRNMSVQQISEYATLNRDVQFDGKADALEEVKNKLDAKEHVFDEIQRILLAADDQYRCILRVMHSFARTVSRSGCLEQADEELLASIFKYMASEADVIDECGLESEFSALELAEYGCRIPVRDEMADALEERNNLMRAALRSPAALERWDFFEPYAQAAGIHRQTLEKKARRQQRMEKLMFWKKKKRPGNPQA